MITETNKCKTALMAIDEVQVLSEKEFAKKLKKVIGLLFEGNNIESLMTDLQVLHERLSAKKSFVVKGLIEKLSKPTIDIGQIKEILTCPITHEMMKCPVITADGQTYEKNAIERWFAYGRPTSPLTNELLDTTLESNIVLEQVINEFEERKEKWFNANREGKTDIVKTLINAGMVLNEKDECEENTALILASDNGHLEVVQALVAAGADKDAVNNYGYTALI